MNSGVKMIRVLKILLFVSILVPFPPEIFSLSVGSNTTFSRQPMPTFPTVATDNRMLGFAAFEQGFALQSKTTTCTFDNFFPVSGTVALQGGRLYLLQDLIFNNQYQLPLGGNFYGVNHSIEFPKQLSDITIPGDSSYFALSQLATGALADTSFSADWSMTDQYIAVSSQASSSTELRVFYFDGATLTQTQALELARNTRTLQWNPKTNHLAYGRDGGSGSELFVNLLNASNGSFANTDTRNFNNNDVLSLAWHPSGNFLAAAIDDNAREVVTYSFNSTTGLLTDITPSGVINLNPNRSVARYGLSWSPGGNYLAIGTSNSSATGAAEFLVCTFNPTSLTITTSVDIGNSVTALDWSPTGTYIAVAVSSTAVRLYQHVLSPQSLQQVTTATITESNVIESVNWDSTGTYLLVGVQNGVNSQLRVYYFDKSALTFSLLSSNVTNSAIEAVRWSHSGNYALLSNNTSVIVYGKTVPSSFLFNNAALVFNTKVNIGAPTFFEGRCKINGRGEVLNINSGGSLNIRPNAQLTFENVILTGLTGNNLRCLTDSGSVVFRNSALFLDRAFTFSRGSILFDHDVNIVGTVPFIYSSRLSSTIASQATLFLNQGLTFSYAPLRANKNLITMADDSAQLYLNGCSLISSRTGLQLSTGILSFDNNVTLSSQARYAAESLSLKSNLNIRMLGGARVDLNGIITYDT